MMNEERKPKQYDAVLGGNNPPPVNGLVLGGIEGVKRRFDKANDSENKIIILEEALAYGDEGEKFLVETISTEIKKLQWFAAVLLLKTKNERYRKKALAYLTKFLKENKNNLIWNQYTGKFYLPFVHRLSLNTIDLSDLRLLGTNFYRVNLSNANFANTTLLNVNLKEANLSNANFSNAELCHCNFSHANLKCVNFSRATFKGVNFQRANFKRAKIEGLNFRDTDIRDANFSLTNYHLANFKGASSKGAKFSKSQ